MNKEKKLFTQIFQPLMLGMTLPGNIILIDQIFSLDVLFSSLLEEFLKFTLALFLIKHTLIRIWGVVFIGLGFGIAELVFRIIFKTGDIFSIFPFLVHIILAVFMTFFLHIANNSKIFWKYLWYTLAFIIPATFHLLYNKIIYLIF